MVEKLTNLNNNQLNLFKDFASTMGSLPTLLLPGTFPIELKNCGINKRSFPRNELVGAIVTKYQGTQLAIETVFYDTDDKCDNGDLHLVNFGEKTLTSYYGGWGTCTDYYGDLHHDNKASLRAKS